MKEFKQEKYQTLSPLRLLLLIIAIIFIAEFGIMIFIIDILPALNIVEAMVDAIILTTLLFPALYFFIFKPLVSSLSQLTQKDDLLNKSYYELEMRVEERTADLAESERRFREMLQTINLVAVILDSEGLITFANDFLLKITGWSEKELLGRSWFHTFIAPEERNEVKKIFKQVLAGGNPLHYENYIVTKKGEKRLINFNNVFLRDSSGKVIGGASIGDDITERKETQELGDALNKINLDISSTLDFNKIMESIVNKAAKAMNIESTWIAIFENNELVVKQGCCLPSILIEKSFNKEYAQGTYDAAKAKKPFSSNDALNDTRLNIDMMQRFKVKSILSVPLVVRDKTIGILYFTNHTKTVSFSEAQKDFANKLAASISFGLENARLYEAEHHIAETLQEALLQSPIKIAGLDFGYLYRPASEEARVGGDFYDIFELEHKKIGILVGDVSGKGLKGATITSLVKNTIKAYAYQNDFPTEIVKKTNKLVVKQSAPGAFVTVFFAILDVESGKLRYCNAGHPLPIVNKESGESHFLKTNSMAIGIFGEDEFDEGQDILEKGDSLTLYTDGIVEAKCKDGNLFGDERLLKIVNKFLHKPIKSTPQSIFEEVMNCTVGTLKDDVVLLVLGRK